MIRGEVSNLLQESAKKCKDAKERERLRALYAISVGYPLPIVAEIFSVGEATLYRWMERWEGGKKLSDRPKRGRPSTFTEREKQIIRKLICEGDPKKYGIEATLWNTKELQEYFSNNGKKVSQETIRRCLKEMGATYTKTDDTRKTVEFAWQFMDDIKIPPSLLMLLEEESPEIQKKYGWTFKR